MQLSTPPSPSYLALLSQKTPPPCFSLPPPSPSPSPATPPPSYPVPPPTDATPYTALPTPPSSSHKTTPPSPCPSPSSVHSPPFSPSIRSPFSEWSCCNPDRRSRWTGRARFSIDRRIDFDESPYLTASWKNSRYAHPQGWSLIADTVLQQRTCLVCFPLVHRDCSCSTSEAAAHSPHIRPHSCHFSPHWRTPSAYLHLSPAPHQLNSPSPSIQADVVCSFRIQLKKDVCTMQQAISTFKYIKQNRPLLLPHHCQCNKFIIFAQQHGTGRVITYIFIYHPLPTNILDGIINNNIMDIGGLLKIVSIPIVEWGEKEVDTWLLYVGLEHLSFHFKKYGLIGQRILAIDLHFCMKELKMKSQIIIKKILRWIQFLNINEKKIERAVFDFHLFKKECFYHCDDKDSQSTGVEDEDCDTQATRLVPARCEDDEILSKTKKNALYCERQNVFDTSSCSSFLIHELFGEEIRFYACHGKDTTIGTSKNQEKTDNDENTKLSSCEIKHFRDQHIICYEVSESKKCYMWCRINFELKIDRGYLLEIGQLTFHVYVNDTELNLRIVRGPIHSAQSFYFDGRFSESIRIGRKPNYQLSFPNDYTMTSYHGRFVYQRNQWYYYDQATANGSWYMMRDREIITNGMTIRIGDSDFIYSFRFDALPFNPADQLQEDDLCLSCHAKVQNCVMRPCYHRVLCRKCAQKWKECPKCRCFTTGLLEVYPQ